MDLGPQKQPTTLSRLKAQLRSQELEREDLNKHSKQTNPNICDHCGYYKQSNSICTHCFRT